jgi:hypothetical protein
MVPMIKDLTEHSITIDVFSGFNLDGSVMTPEQEASAVVIPPLRRVTLHIP